MSGSLVNQGPYSVPGSTPYPSLYLNAGNLIRIPQLFTGTGIYTVPDRCRTLIIEMVGCGGCGASVTGDGTNYSGGGGGGGGGYGIGYFTVLGGQKFFINCTVGIAGGGGDTTGSTSGVAREDQLVYYMLVQGGTSGQSITSALRLCTRGAAGASPSSNSNVLLFSAGGQPGGCGIAVSAANAVSGCGGSTPWGTGGRSRDQSEFSSVGLNGTGYGAGGGGAIAVTGSKQNGGNGADAAALVWEYA